MLVYYVLVTLIIIFGLSAQYISANKPIKAKTYKNGIVQNKNQYSFYYVLIIFMFVFLGGLRYKVGSDYKSYYISVFTREDVIDSIKTLNEPLTKIISYLCRQVWDEGIFVIFVFNLLIVLLVFYGFSKYDENKITLYALLFLFLGAWTFSFNGIRQAFACVIIFVGSSILEKEENTWVKHTLKLLIICFVAFLAHKAALLMLPILLISERRIDLAQIFLLIASAIAIPLLFDNAFDFMEVDNSVDAAGASYIYHEINPIRVPVAFSPLILLALIKNKEELFYNERFMTNMAFFHAILNLATMNSAYMHRMTQFTVYFVIVFIVRAIKRIDPKIRGLVTIITLLLYFGYWVYGLYMSKDLWFEWAFGHFGEF